MTVQGMGYLVLAAVAFGVAIVIRDSGHWYLGLGIVVVSWVIFGRPIIKSIRLPKSGDL